MSENTDQPTVPAPVAANEPAVPADAAPAADAIENVVERPAAPKEAVNSTHTLVIGRLAGEETATGALQQLLAAAKTQQLEIPASAAVRKDSAGVVDIKETGDIGATQGAVAGGLIGGLLGMFSGKTTLGAGLGALIGGAGAHYLDTGIPDPRLKEIGSELAPGWSAVVAIVKNTAFDAVATILTGIGAKVVGEPIRYDSDLGGQLAQGQYGDAANTLANQAERAIADAGAFVAGAAQSAASQAQDFMQSSNKSTSKPEDPS
ncbi:MAG: DUF1269 domain-containing protein [Anaerolineales bacterium]|nr:DUF1269 domain-containing protein [Anaerolineales bacterium]